MRDGVGHQAVPGGTTGGALDAQRTVPSACWSLVMRVLVLLSRPGLAGLSDFRPTAAWEACGWHCGDGDTRPRTSPAVSHSAGHP